MNAPLTGNVTRSTGSLRAIRIIAEREIMTRLKQRSFLIMTAVLVVGVAAGIFLLDVVGGSSSALRVASTDSSMTQVLEASTQAAGVDADVTTVADRAAGEAKLSDGDLDALVIPGDGGALGVVVQQDLPGSLQPVLQGIAQQQALADQVTALGGDPTEVATAVAQARVDVTSLETPSTQDVTQIIVGFLVGIIMFMALMICAQLVGVGVVEEKTSRVIELLLSTVKPTELLAGKVLGIGLVGLVQVGLTLLAAVFAASATGQLDGLNINLGSTVVWALVWFLVGFATFALVLAALASLVSRQEEVGSVTTPATIFMVIPYVIGINTLPHDPSNELATTLSYIPGFAPFLMPLRDAMGAVELWEQLVALAISLAVIPVIVWLGGKIYANAVLRTGARIKLKDALKSA